MTRQDLFEIRSKYIDMDDNDPCQVKEALDDMGDLLDKAIKLMDDLVECQNERDRWERKYRVAAWDWRPDA